MIDDFYQPVDTSILCRRYVSLAKLVDMLSTRTIYLAALRTLADKFEGLPPGIFRRAIAETTKQYMQDWAREQGELVPELGTEELRIGDLVRHVCFVSCWSRGEDESDALWRLYCGLGDGVAVVTRYSTLRRVIDSKDTIGCVRYVDHNACDMPDSNLLHMAMMKRNEFAYESEVRVLRTDWTQWDGGVPGKREGARHEIDPDELIERVEVSPYAPVWYYEVVKAVVARFLLKAEVVPSALSVEPKYTVTSYRRINISPPTSAPA